MAQRNGDFSALPVTIYDPRTTRPNPNGTGFVRDPFPGNVIPQDRISSISRYFQSFLPDPTNAALQNNYLGGALPIGFNNENLTTKVDLKPTTRQQLSVLFSMASTVRRRPTEAGPIRRPPCRCRIRKRGSSTRFRRAPRSNTHTFWDSQWVNQASAGFSRLSVPIFNATSTAISDQRRSAGTAGRRADSSFPEVAFAGPNAPTQWRGTDARAFTEYLNNYTLQDNLTRRSAGTR